MHFIVQENINKEDFKEFTDAIVNLGHTFESFYHKPFDNSYPEIDTRKPTFIYAASSVTDAIFDEYNGFAGVFNHTRGINIHNFYKVRADLMWSPRAYQGTLASVLTDIKPNDQLIFARPAIDDKLFAGQVSTQEELIETCKRMINADPSLANHEVFLGGYKPPNYEYRLFVIAGEVVASSQYRVDGFVYPVEGSPKKVKDKANEFHHVHSDILPAAYVIDIATNDDETDIGVIEINCIHNSGFYDIIKSNLISGIARFMETAL